MRCGRVRRNLMAYHDGELDMDASEKIRKHLQDCRGCSGMLVSLEKVDHATGSPEVPDPGSSYWDTFTSSVMEKVKDEALAQRREPEHVPARTPFSPFRFVPAVSVALVVVVAAGVLIKMREPAIPKRAVYQQDAADRKEVSPVLKGEQQTDIDNKVAGLSATEQITAEPVPGGLVEKQETGKAALKTPPDSVRIKKEAAADESERFADAEEEAEMRFAGKDDSASAVPPPPADRTSVRSFPAAPSQEPVSGSEGFAAAGEPLVAQKAIDDGSWGQLAFARKLEEEGNHVESEKVLDDLLAREPSSPVQEQASILLVSVLASQNRLPEARQVLEDAQRQYPDNMTIQNYRIGNEE